MINQKITIEKLNEDRWQDYRDLRLEALKNEPLAFSSSYEEEQAYPERVWCERIKNFLFVMAENQPVGMAGIARNTHLKTSHVCEMFGVYLRKDYRGQGTGKRLIEETLKEMQNLKGVKIIEVWVNPAQKAAKHLYKKYGFKVVGHFKKAMYINNKFYDTLTMEKLL